jgi:ADP-ribosyl-[dinitrogen reductase] hydrolase
MNRRSYARGSLLGLAIGDAGGTSLEFSHPGPFPWNPLLTGPHTEVTGGGPFRVLPGQVTDDSMEAAALATSLKACDGFDLDDVAQKYYDWRKVTFDIGGQTSGSLSALGNGIPPDESGRYCWERGGSHAAGNGSLMRTAPIGVFFCDDLEAIVKVSLYDSGITHFDPRCMLACAAMNAAIGLRVRTDGVLTPKDLTREAYKGLVLAADIMISQNPYLKDKIHSALRDLENDLTLATQADPWLYGTGDIAGTALDMLGQQGFVRVAFRLAFWELHHAPSFEAGLIDCVNRGGDSDSNGAICGMLLGAFYGDAGIPTRWSSVVLSCDPPGALGKNGSFHPARLMELAEVV